ncbi:N-acetylmuramoyl-L-alanine amidase [Marinicella meishanensis]|uniref:golvesin C-terminal-like domain-containing protein n=1 Tax=Marinicella meishanensis TaxID=2873263 RepID=UPI001CC12C84|nr:N-acetylmuramoyl-L-alanine amidase [Marinicella sp. NBU2979]
MKPNHPAAFIGSCICACCLLWATPATVQAQIIAQQGQFSDHPETNQASATLLEQTQMLLENHGLRDQSDLLPAGTRVTAAALLGEDLIITLAPPKNWLDEGLNEATLDQLSRLLDLNLDWLAPTASRIHLNVWHGGQKVALSNFLNIQPVPNKPDDTSIRVHSSGTATDLSDKTLFISQAHGWIDYDDFRQWSTQRGITHDIVEDFVNAEGINQYLLQYLAGAGAEVFTLRERDLNTQMVIVDDADGNSFPANGSYQEIGDASWFSDSGANGFANFQAPYSASNDPFRDNGGSDRLITTNPTETAQAVWTPVITESGHYDVYVSYSGIGNRPHDARYTVRHGGLESTVLVDQTKHRYVWNHLGNFYFTAGGDHAIRLSNQSAAAGTTVSADAVRIGGGMGDILGQYHTVLSGHPRWEEGARTWTQYQGASASVYAGGDVSARSRFADWEHYSSEDSVYVSWHSNAATGNARGTSSYIYSANPPDGTYDTTQAHPGSAELQTAIHEELINDIRGAWDSNWTDRGKRSAYFGEVNPSHNDEMPAVLLEMAFHDNAQDADALRHPQFRRLAARAIYQGIVKYFATRDGLSYTLLPEPPTHLQVTSTTPGELTIDWQAAATDNQDLGGDAADDFLVFLSTDGKNFAPGIPAASNGLQLTGMPPGQVQYVQVKARNAGGVSLPTETLAARVAHANESRVLVVNGFDRLNSGQLIYQNMPDIGGFVDRMYLSQMNTFDYIIQHGEAIDESGVGFDGISNELIEDALWALNPTEHAAVFWILGEESSLGETLNASEQLALNNYLSAGGKLFISGAEIAWDLDFLGNAADQDFYHNTLKTTYSADDANTFTADGLPGSPFAHLSNLLFDDGTGPTYRVEFPDVISPINGSSACLEYLGQQTACTYVDTGTYQVIHLGFPFETIVAAAGRHDLMAAALDYFAVPHFSDLIFASAFE